MPCFNPNWVRQTIAPSGEITSVFCGTAKGLNPLEFSGIDKFSEDGVRQVLVPCGKCIGCKIDYSHEWSNRLCIELKDNDNKAIFVTLTYNDEHLPFESEFTKQPVLCVRDVQLFFKRLRKHFSDKRIRFYLAGEYGPSTHRPHYHAIIFGLSLEDFDDLVLYRYNDLKQPLYKSSTFASIWKNGFVTLAEVSQKTCAYVARYCCKKYFRLLNGGHIDVVPEFTICSRRPGIGFLNAKDIVDSEITKFPIKDMNGVSFYYLPKSVFDKGIADLKQSDPYKASRLLYQRAKAGESVDLLGFDSYDRLLEYQEELLLKKLKLLKDGVNE